MDVFQPDGTLAVPAASSAGAVLVLHAWWGLNEAVKSFCNQLAEAGFTAFAPDRGFALGFNLVRPHPHRRSLRDGAVAVSQQQVG